MKLVKKLTIFCLCLFMFVCIFLLNAFADEQITQMKGDIDGDSEITASDARLALRLAVHLDVMTDEIKEVADIDSSGAVDSSDARILLRIAVKLESLDNYVFNVDIGTEITDNGYFVYEDSIASIKVLTNRDVQDVCMQIVDAEGNVVYEINDFEIEDNKETVLTWDGCNKDGIVVAEGDYSIVFLLNNIEFIGEKIHFYGVNCFDGGNGSAKRPFLISHIEQFDNIEKFPSASYKQISDLDFENGEYTSKFTTIRFEGYYDGNNKQFVNLASAGALWKNVGENGVIKNININKSSFNASTALVENNYGMISDCNVNASIAYTYGDGNVHMGLIAGTNYGIIINCTAKGTASSTATKYQAISIVGGICGYNNGKILSCTAFATLSSAATDSYWGGLCCGGIAGQNAAEGFIQNCESAGQVNPCSKYAGITAVNDGQVVDSIVTGNVPLQLVHSGNGNIYYTELETDKIEIENSFAKVEGSISGDGFFVNTLSYFELTILPLKDINTASFFIYNAADELVYSSVLESLKSDEEEVFIWNGTNNKGKVVNTGVYKLDIVLDNKTLSINNIKFYDTAYFSGGNGTAESPFEISKASQFKDIVRFHSAYFVQTDDLDFEFDGCISYFPADSQFCGSYNGNGKTIMNLLSDAPLFNYIGENGVIENMNIANCSFSNKSAICLINNGKITNCTVEATVTTQNGTDSAIYVGLIASQNYGIINKCSTSGVASATATKYQAVAVVGGICGINHNKVIQCSSTVKTSANATDNYWGGIYSGGIVGDNAAKGFVQSCTASGDISARSAIGGIAGKNDGQINNCTYTGSSTTELIGTGSGTVA